MGSRNRGAPATDPSVDGIAERQPRGVLRHRQPRNRQAAGLAAQKRDLTAAGAERIFGEQVSSTAKRVKLAECLAFRREGDVLTITKPDRLARSTAELPSIEADRVHKGMPEVMVGQVLSAEAK